MLPKNYTYRVISLLHPQLAVPVSVTVLKNQLRLAQLPVREIRGVVELRRVGVSGRLLVVRAVVEHRAVGVLGVAAVGKRQSVVVFVALSFSVAIIAHYNLYV